MKHITPMIYTTKYCNMGCKYCYTGSAWEYSLGTKKINESFRSKIPLLFEFIDQVVSHNNYTHTKFIFLGGEPLSISPENYESVLRYIREKDYPIKISIQTNGSLINMDFIDLFKEFNVDIGVSLDGGASLNDQTRIFKNGKETFSTIFKNLQKMKDAGLKFGCLVTLNKTNMEYVEKIYTFFKENNIPFNIRPISETKYSAPRKLLITPQEYARSLCKLFNIWFEDTETEDILVEDFANMVSQFIKPIKGLVPCVFTKKCSEYFVSFDLNGDLYPCNRLYGIPQFFYGNIQRNSLKNLLNNSKVKCLSERWDILSKTDCKNCEISQYCYGGCPGNGYFYYYSFFRKDYYCGAYRTILRHVYEKIIKEVKGDGLFFDKKGIKNLNNGIG